MTVRLTSRELDVMSVLWKLESATVAEVRDRLTDELAYPTVLTVLRTLELKGHVRHELEGKAFRWFPTILPDQAGDGALQRLLNRVYNGSRELIIARILANENISAAELKRIRRQLDARLKDVNE